MDGDVGARHGKADGRDGATSGELYRATQGTRTMTSGTKGFLTSLWCSWRSSRRRGGDEVAD
jgi:hypothetical protein